MVFKQESSLQEYNRLYKKYDSIWHELALGLELSDSALTILYRILEEGDGCLQRDLCGSTSLSKQTIHSSIRKLQEQGILTLERGRGRELRVRLTPTGQQLAAEKIFPLMELENAAFRELGPEDSRRLLALTAKYTSIFEEKAREHLRHITNPCSPGGARNGQEKGT